MSNILAIETTLGGCSVAISGGANLHEATRNKQTTALPAMVKTVMKQSNLTYDMLDAYAVTNGPGSFTGVRLGLAFTRGLALAAPKPFITINSLELIAYQAIQHGAKGKILAAINAYRNQLYIQQFEAKNTLPSALSAPQAINIEAISTLEDVDYIAGDATDFFADSLQALPLMPNAQLLAQYASNLQYTAEKPSPLYLRLPDAKAQSGDLTA